jgi:deoxyribonuclease V
MKYRELHPWNVTPTEAVRIQNELKEKIILEPLPKKIRLVAGADISYERFSDWAYAGFVVLDAKTLKIVATASAEARMTFPYVPGLLTFREAGPLLQAWKKLTLEPDVVIFDGQGIAHPRRMGIASHMGLIIDRPTLGCGKSLLCGGFGELGEEKGSSSPLIYKGEQVGVALRTKSRTNPVFISPGHRADLQTSVPLVLGLTAGYRIPEPTRQAHLYVNQLRREARTLGRDAG